MTCGPEKPCDNGNCCSKWGYCGDTEDYCGEGCQSNCNVNKPGSFDSVFQNKGQFQLAVDFE